MRELQAKAEFDRQQAMLEEGEAFIARFKARASHAAQVQSRVKKLDKIEKVEPPRRAASFALRFSASRPAPATTWRSSRA
jgi:ATPase subunit of ABC transporter with duplicated ATPase domains